MTLFIGPNNSGKSRLLTELHDYCEQGVTGKNLLLDSVTFKGMSPACAHTAIITLDGLTVLDPPITASDISYVSSKGQHTVSYTLLFNTLQNPDADPLTFCEKYLGSRLLTLDGPRRLSLANSQPAGDLRKRPTNALQVLFRDDAKREEVSRILYSAFERHFVVDPTELGTFHIALSSTAGTLHERSLSDAALAIYNEAERIDSASDGVKAFSGILIELIAGDHKVLFIDEPEAFLHPSLAFTLGAEVAKHAAIAKKQVFASTHSPMFLMGCIQSGIPLNIVRLTFRDGVATSRVLQSENLTTFMRRPLLRSLGVLNSVFYEYVVVTEADTDRAFYHESNDRLLRFDDGRGIPHCLFINAQNKQTLRTVVQPLRDLGIPTAMISDIDVLKDDDAEWRRLLSSVDVPESLHSALLTDRLRVRTAIEGTGLDMKRGGIDLLGDKDRTFAVQFLDTLREYGVFVVPRGEVESWLKNLGATGHGPKWLVKIFERMGEDPEDAEFIRPTDGDVWQFIGAVREWLMNPLRKGIPDEPRSLTE